MPTKNENRIITVYQVKYHTYPCTWINGTSISSEKTFIESIKSENITSENYPPFLENATLYSVI